MPMITRAVAPASSPLPATPTPADIAASPTSFCTVSATVVGLPTLIAVGMPKAPVCMPTSSFLSPPTLGSRLSRTSTMIFPAGDGAGGCDLYCKYDPPQPATSESNANETLRMVGTPYRRYVDGRRIVEQLGTR